ncbi:hypothetical protein [Burkholderia gladioli]|uniref:hypothetical protein n=1 Tax=Burkholderia gladioli TaxID=28095 RepID=UPI001640F0EF|nr:hypothetical protein [Burkholderia gladioli]
MVNARTCWHGSTVGWINKIDQRKGRTYGFQTKLNVFGETKSAQDFIWITEAEQRARNQTQTSLDEVVKRQTAGEDPFQGKPMKAGRWVYEVQASKYADQIDLGEPTLSGGMLARLLNGVAATRQQLGIGSAISAIRLASPAQRLTKFTGEHAWLDWLSRELGLYDSQQNSLTSDDERFARVVLCAKHAGFNWIGNIQAHTHPNSTPYMCKWPGDRDWGIIPKIHLPDGRWVRTYNITKVYQIK